MVNSPLSSKLLKASQMRPFSTQPFFIVDGVLKANAENVSSTFDVVVGVFLPFSSTHVVEFKFSSSVRSIKQSSRVFFVDSLFVDNNFDAPSGSSQFSSTS